MAEILLITTDHKLLWWKLSEQDLHRTGILDINTIIGYLNDNNHNTEVLNFAQLDWKRDYSGVYVFYAGDETPGNVYRKRIDDAIYFLHNAGAILIPDYMLFKAYGNKCYMEMLRQTFKNDAFKTINSKIYGSFKEFIDCKDEFSYPCVIKPAIGSGSMGVALVKSKNELYKAAYNVSQSNYLQLTPLNILRLAKRKVERIIRKHDDYSNCNNRNGFVVQNFIPNMPGDYKVLIYWDKYYTLYRKNRDNDFRASGSGLLSLVPEDQNTDILEFARSFRTEIDTPFMSLDIGYDGKIFHLIEFQCMAFGPYTLQASDYYYTFENQVWKIHRSKSSLELEIARTIDQFIRFRQKNEK